MKILTKYRYHIILSICIVVLLILVATMNVSVYAASAPAKVKSIYVRDVTSNSCHLTWSKASGASGYIVYRRSESTYTYKAVKSTSSRSFRDSKLKEGKQYYYRVRAYKKYSGSKRYGAYSRAISVRTTNLGDIRRLSVDELWKVADGQGVKIVVRDVGFNMENIKFDKYKVDSSHADLTDDRESAHGANMCRNLLNVAPKASLYLFTGSCVDAIHYAEEIGADILITRTCNDDWYPEGNYVSDLEEAVQGTDVSIFCTGGNTGLEELHYPASIPGVISVSACYYNDTVSSYVPCGSNTKNSHNYISAPGATTSVATAHAAGYTALLYQIKPDMTNSELMSYMKSTALDIGSTGYDISTGYGLIQPYSIYANYLM